MDRDPEIFNKFLDRISGQVKRKNQRKIRRIRQVVPLFSVEV